MPTGARVSGAQIALRVELQRDRLGDLLRLPLPWALRALRRNDHPITPQRVPAAMGFLHEWIDHDTASRFVACLACRATAPSTASHTYTSAAMPKRP